MQSLLKPTLYASTNTGPILLGGQCECGFVFFPMQTFGCERCGKSGEALKPRALRANGKLTTASVVYIHADKHRPAPFAIGVIALDEGPVICTLLLDLDLAKEAQQKRVAGEWVQIALGDGSQAFDLRFRPEAKDTASQVER